MGSARAADLPGIADEQALRPPGWPGRASPATPRALLVWEGASRLSGLHDRSGRGRTDRGAVRRPPAPAARVRRRAGRAARAGPGDGAGPQDAGQPGRGFLRRTFAVVQATTKSRVDLGLRLDNSKPGGRLLAARDIGAANLRIPLTGPGDIDDEVLGWLRRAYDENAAPPPPRRAARRPAAVLGQITVLIDGYDLPGLTCRPEPGGSGHRNVHVALSGKGKDRPFLVVPDRPGLAIEPVPGDAKSARWELPVTVRRDADGFDFTGPFVGGTRDDRNLGLAWGDVPGDGTLRLFRGAKLRLVDVDPAADRGGPAPRAPAGRPDPPHRSPGQPGLRPRPSPGARLVGRARLTRLPGQGVIAMSSGSPERTGIGLPGLLVAVLIGVTVPLPADGVGGLSVRRDRDDRLAADADRLARRVGGGADRRDRAVALRSWRRRRSSRPG